MVQRMLKLLFQTIHRSRPAGGSVPGRQDSVTEGFNQLSIADSPAMLPLSQTQPWSRPTRQLRELNRGACTVCKPIRFTKTPSAKPSDLEDLIGALYVEETPCSGTSWTVTSSRTTINQTIQNRSPTEPHLPNKPFTVHSQCHWVTRSTTARCPIARFVTSLCQTGKRESFPNCAGPQRWLFRAASSPRFATAWAESLEGAITRHDTWALLCRYRSRPLPAEIPNSSELKLRVRMWEEGHTNDLIARILGQQNSGPLRRTRRPQQPQTDEQRGKRACALTTRGSVSKAMKSLVGGSSARLSRLPETPDRLSHSTKRRGRYAHHPRGKKKPSDTTGLGLRAGTKQREQGPHQIWHRVSPAREACAHECTGTDGRSARAPGCHCLLCGADPAAEALS